MHSYCSYLHIIQAGSRVQWSQACQALDLTSLQFCEHEWEGSGRKWRSAITVSGCSGITQRMPSLELQWARGQDKLLRVLSMLRSERLVEIREVNSSTSSQANVWQEKLSQDTRDRRRLYLVFGHQDHLEEQKTDLPSIPSAQPFELFLCNWMPIILQSGPLFDATYFPVSTLLKYIHSIFHCTSVLATWKIKPWLQGDLFRALNVNFAQLIKLVLWVYVSGT